MKTVRTKKAKAKLDRNKCPHCDAELIWIEDGYENETLDNTFFCNLRCDSCLSVFVIKYKPFAYYEDVQE